MDYVSRFLTTASPGEINRCNGVPVAIYFEKNVRKVTLHFAGASVAYTLSAFDKRGRLLGKVQKESVFRGGVFTVSIGSTTDVIHKITFGHQAAITAIKEVHFERAEQVESGAMEPLPHDVSLSLKYVIQERRTGGDGVGTWRSIEFDEVTQENETEIVGIRHIRTLPELDTIYRIMSESQHRCQLIVHCQADLATRTLNQIFIPGTLKGLALNNKINLSDLKLEVLPTAKPNLHSLRDRGNGYVQLHQCA